MRSIQVNELFMVDSSRLLKIRTISGYDFLCYKRFVSTNMSGNSEQIGLFGFRYQDESESDIYAHGLTLDRTIPFDQIITVLIEY